MPRIDNFIITLDCDYNLISFNYGLNLNLIKSELTTLSENKRYIVANVFDTTFFITKRRFLFDNTILYNFHFEKFKLINLPSIKNITLNISPKIKKSIDIIGFFLLLGYQENKEIMQAVEKNKITVLNSNLRYCINLMLSIYNVSTRSQLRKKLMLSQANTIIPSCLLKGVAPEEFLQQFLVT
ncbi:MAG: hypothetical protein LW807_07100 [Proteobacteria bacterium]|jgi:hypothetical protein|nr:hypothetical protein [Pseudomonadota bacterium]